MTTINATHSLVSALQQLQSNFSVADADGSKALSQTEFANAAKLNPGLTGGTTAAAQFTKLDADKNGALTSKELTQGLSLESQVYSVLLQGQEITSGGAFMQLLGGSSGTSSLFGNNDFSSLTSNLLGGGNSSTSLISLLSGASANTTTLASLFGNTGSMASQLQNILNNYFPTDITA